MTELLQPNEVVCSHSGQPCEVLDFLGGGGQGEVYRARWGGGLFALKWYYAASATREQRVALEALIEQGAPSDAFLWPEDLAEARGVPGYGYIMRLRPKEYKRLNAALSGGSELSFFVLITAGIGLTKALRSLHNKGLCYRDISLGNAFMHPATGAVLICDNDNVATNKAAGGGILGTPEFMAPEIVRMEALPSTKTDLHSLAVLLFHLLCLGHPLVGRRALAIRCLDPAAREWLFGTAPRFIFDPQDGANAAVTLAEDPSGETGGHAIAYWSLYPDLLRRTFLKAFTAGLRDPDARVTELEWLDTLAALRDAIFRCPCGTPNFYDTAAAQAAGGRPGRCWSCGKEPPLPFRIAIGRRLAMLNADTKLYPHHMADGRDYDFSVPVAEVARHPKEPGIWGLKNLGREKWEATVRGGLRDVEPGRSVVLAAGTKVNFGAVEGTIVY